jgi:hypothetical protein
MSGVYFSGIVIGSDNLTEYGPIIASLLLRVRLELCVVESYFFEAVVPFISQRGFSWILPVHETVETFLTGSIFAIATNIILLTSTKVISALVLAVDVLTGMPARFIGSVLKRFPKSFEVVSIILQIYGSTLGYLRSALEKVDNFIGRYMFVSTVLYIAFKYAHYKYF